MPLSLDQIPPRIGWIAGMLAAFLSIGASVRSIRDRTIVPAWKYVVAFFRSASPRRQALLDQIAKDLAEIKPYVTPNGGQTIREGGKSIPDSIKRLEEGQIIHGERFYAYIDADQAPMFRMDVNGNVTKTTKALCELLNVDERRLVYREWKNAIIEDQRARVEREIDHAIHDGREFDIVTSTTRGLRIRISGTPIKVGTKVHEYQGSVHTAVGLPDHAPRPKTLFILEDFKATRDALERTLGIGDMETVSVDTIQRAIDWINTHGAPDYAVLDIMLPDGDGFGVVDLMRKKNPFTQILVLSGAGVGMEDAAQQRGVAYLNKPADPAAIRRELQMS